MVSEISMNGDQVLPAERVEVRVQGMDCAECCAHVQRSIAALPGVRHVDVFLASEKAVIEADPGSVDMAEVRRAVEAAGYHAADASAPSDAAARQAQFGQDFARSALAVLGLVFAAVLLVVVAGEWLGLFEAATARIPWPAGAAIVLLAWYPVLVKVVRAALQRQVLAHTLMSVGVVAALAIGEWVTAAIVVFFMRVGDQVERYTAEQARRAVKGLTALAPKTARIEFDGDEKTVPIEEVRPGDVAVVRPGELIPVDGEVVAGHATVNQATLTGESMPVEAGPGTMVYAATTAELGSLRVRTQRTGADSTFGRVIALVEEAEANKAEVQRLADRFSAYFLPAVALIAALTLALRRDPMAMVAVLVVACSCSFALATPIAVLASIGAGAKRGLLIKGGKYLELLAKADVVLIDKTGTLTLGRPQITDVVAFNGAAPNKVLALAGAAERYSEHPLAEAVRRKCRAAGLMLAEPETFEALPGFGVRAKVDGTAVVVGNERIVPGVPDNAELPVLRSQGKTLLFVAVNEAVIGVLAAADTLRSEAPQAIAALRALGIRQIEVLTGDNEQAAAALGAALGVPCRANLLPADKLAVVKEYQARGHTVAMAGDGVNDAPALAQADVGIAMGAAGTAVAAEAAHVVLMRDDWMLTPQVIRIGRRTLGVIRLNILFTGLYNLVGLTLAAFGILPPIAAAAAQSLPDLGILANSSRLLRQKE